MTNPTGDPLLELSLVGNNGHNDENQDHVLIGKQFIERARDLSCAGSCESYNPLRRARLGAGAPVQAVRDARAHRAYGNVIHEAAYLTRQISCSTG